MSKTLKMQIYPIWKILFFCHWNPNTYCCIADPTFVCFAFSMHRTVLIVDMIWQWKSKFLQLRFHLCFQPLNQHPQQQSLDGMKVIGLMRAVDRIMHILHILRSTDIYCWEGVLYLCRHGYKVSLQFQMHTECFMLNGQQSQITECFWLIKLI